MPHTTVANPKPKRKEGNSIWRWVFGGVVMLGAASVATEAMPKTATETMRAIALPEDVAQALTAVTPEMLHKAAPHVQPGAYTTHEQNEPVVSIIKNVVASLLPRTADVVLTTGALTVNIAIVMYSSWMNPDQRVGPARRIPFETITTLAPTGGVIAGQWFAWLWEKAQDPLIRRAVQTYTTWNRAQIAEALFDVAHVDVESRIVHLLIPNPQVIELETKHLADTWYRQGTRLLWRHVEVHGPDALNPLARATRGLLWTRTQHKAWRTSMCNVWLHLLDALATAHDIWPLDRMLPSPTQRAYAEGITSFPEYIGNLQRALRQGAARTQSDVQLASNDVYGKGWLHVIGEADLLCEQLLAMSLALEQQLPTGSRHLQWIQEPGLDDDEMIKRLNLVRIQHNKAAIRDHILVQYRQIFAHIDTVVLKPVLDLFPAQRNQVQETHALLNASSSAALQSPSIARVQLKQWRQQARKPPPLSDEDAQPARPFPLSDYDDEEKEMDDLTDKLATPQWREFTLYRDDVSTQQIMTLYTEQMAYRVGWINKAWFLRDVGVMQTFVDWNQWVPPDVEDKLLKSLAAYALWTDYEKQVDAMDAASIKDVEVLPLFFIDYLEHPETLLSDVSQLPPSMDTPPALPSTPPSSSFRVRTPTEEQQRRMNRIKDAWDNERRALVATIEDGSPIDALARDVHGLFNTLRGENSTVQPTTLGDVERGCLTTIAALCGEDAAYEEYGKTILLGMDEPRLVRERQLLSVIEKDMTTNARIEMMINTADSIDLRTRLAKVLPWDGDPDNCFRLTRLYQNTTSPVEVVSTEATAQLVDLWNKEVWQDDASAPPFRLPRQDEPIVHPPVPPDAPSWIERWRRVGREKTKQLIEQIASVIVFYINEVATWAMQLFEIAAEWYVGRTSTEKADTAFRVLTTGLMVIRGTMQLIARYSGPLGFNVTRRLASFTATVLQCFFKARWKETEKEEKNRPEEHAQKDVHDDENDDLGIDLSRWKTYREELAEEKKQEERRRLEEVARKQQEDERMRLARKRQEDERTRLAEVVRKQQEERSRALHSPPAVAVTPLVQQAQVSAMVDARMKTVIRAQKPKKKKTIVTPRPAADAAAPVAALMFLLFPYVHR